jgi:flavin-dependent dehydrogenase
MMNDRRVHIIGAGPASLIAAINLARNGYEIIIYEQKNDVGWRFKGDFQGIENWTTEEDALDFLKTIGVFINFRYDPYSIAYFYDPILRKVTIESNRPLFYLVERGTVEWSLDQGLKRQALAEGVKFQWNHKLETLPSGWVIVGTGPKAADAIAKGIVFKTSHPDLCVGFLDNRIAPKAYAYLLVNNYKATFATCLFEDFQNERTYFVRALKTLQQTINLDIKEPKEFGGYVNFFLKPSAVKHGHILYVGETAGFQDALWGFGLRYAMLSGYLAAVSIKTGLFYDNLCRQHLKPLLETSLANRWLFSHLGNWGYRWLLNRTGKEKDVVGALRRHYQSSHSKVLLFRIAGRRYKTRLIDKQCMHQNCDCVWCRHCKTSDKYLTKDSSAHPHLGR